MRAPDDSLSKENRTYLEESIFRIFIENKHKEYTKRIHNSPMDIKQMYEGYQTFPRPYGDSGFEIIAWNNFGEIQTPNFHGKFDPFYYETENRVNIPVYTKIA